MAIIIYLVTVLMERSTSQQKQATAAPLGDAKT